MKGFTGRYMNEIVSLTILALMTVALIAGQADATVHESVRSGSSFEENAVMASLDTILDGKVVHAELAIRLDLDDLTDLKLESELREIVRDLIGQSLKRDK